MAKVTFSLDDDTVRTLKETAERHRKPQSAIVREAIAHYASREHMLSPDERDRLLNVLRHIERRRPSRPESEVDRELREIRRSRRRGWSRPVR
jgi:hypothetical protein